MNALKKSTTLSYPTCPVMKISNESITLKEIPLPAYVSPKVDGVYCMVYNGQYYSRTLKPYPNLRLRAFFHQLTVLTEEQDHIFIGELVADTFSRTNSLVRSRKTRLSGLRFCLFDYTSKSHFDRCSGYVPFQRRWEQLNSLTDDVTGRDIKLHRTSPVTVVPHRIVTSLRELQRYHDLCLNLGFEGIVTKNPDSYYKHGRTTKKNFNQAKFRHTATIRGHIVEVHNKREMSDDTKRTLTADGYLEKVHTKGSFNPTQLLGSFTVKFEDGRVGKVGLGKGFNQAEQRRLWKIRKDLVGLECEVTYLVAGNKDLPRQPKITRIREDLI